jgi:hypoxanthine phosphoribosyltransferase
LTQGEGSERAAPAAPSFAHASEAELARILDFYDVRWAYEPDTFPIGWNLDGDVIESFSPDFYLPDLDLYVELTTLKQKLVRKKNRKLRRLRELYPDVRIKLFYARDFRALLLKFGRMALVDELTGTTGQATPPRTAVDAAAVAAAAEATVDPAIAALLAVRQADAELAAELASEVVVPAALPAGTPAVSPVAAAIVADGAPGPVNGTGRGRRRGRRRRRPAG